MSENIIVIVPWYVACAPRILCTRHCGRHDAFDEACFYPRSYYRQRLGFERRDTFDQPRRRRSPSLDLERFQLLPKPDEPNALAVWRATR